MFEAAALLGPPAQIELKTLKLDNVLIRQKIPVKNSNNIICTK